MTNLIFLYNELMNPDIFSMMRLPIEFIAFGIADGKMYTHTRSNSNFILPEGVTKAWGNSKVYGALFLCKDIQFYLGLLDAYHACSMDTLRKNHIMDLHHRETIEVQPIYFKTLEELRTLKYMEGKETIEAITYLGNIKHPKIKNRLDTTKSYRINSGIDSINYKKLFMEVLQ